MNKTVVLGFDYGEKRIGTAIGQCITRSASPLITVRVYRQGPDWTTINQLVEEWQPNILVVGFPLNMYGQRQAITTLTEKFIRQLKTRYTLPIDTVDERLSSFEAKDRLQREHDLDPTAAQIIIETWFSIAKRCEAKT